jgi:hypothetical protein
LTEPSCRAFDEQRIAANGAPTHIAYSALIFLLHWHRKAGAFCGSSEFREFWTSHSRASDSDRTSLFPVPPRKFPARPSKIPCFFAQGILLQTIESADQLRAESAEEGQTPQNSLLNSLLSGNSARRRVRIGLRPQRRKTKVAAWEQGTKKPSGPASELLQLVDRKGLDVLA